jgi:hypothetical protein
MHPSNPNNWKVKAGGLQVQGQLELHSKTLTKKKKKKYSL